jgi:hypothetical protein
LTEDLQRDMHRELAGDIAVTLATNAIGNDCYRPVLAADLVIRRFPEIDRVFIAISLWAGGRERELAQSHWAIR